MQVRLHSERIDIEKCFHIALIDAAIWVWLYQVVYTDSITPPLLTGDSWIGHCLANMALLAIVLVFRWDIPPQRAFLVTPAIASFSCAALMALSSFGAPTALLDVVLFVLSACICLFQLLRLLNLLRCDNIRVLSVVLCLSIMLFYVFNLALSVATEVLRDAFIVLAPFAFLPCWKGQPIEPTKNMRPFSVKSLCTLPNTLVIVFGILGGFSITSGNLGLPSGLHDLFYNPLPTYPAMQLFCMVLTIVVACGLRFAKTTYFIIANFAWSTGAMLGLFAQQIAEQVPEALSFVLATAAMLSFFLFQSAWIDRPEGMPQAPSRTVEEVAAAHGLTKRETEVAALLAEGRSIPYIQTALFISEGTAKSHAKKIYAKMGVHTKQELMSLFKNEQQ